MCANITPDQEPSAQVISLDEYRKTGIVPASEDYYEETISPEQFLKELEDLNGSFWSQLTFTNLNAPIEQGFIEWEKTVKPKPKSFMQSEIDAIIKLQEDIEEYKRDMRAYFKILNDPSSASLHKKYAWKSLREVFRNISSCRHAIDVKKSNIKKSN